MVKIKDIISDEAYRIVQDHFGGQRIYIPKNGAGQTEMDRRNKAIKSEFRKLGDSTGLTRDEIIKELCVAFSLSRSRIEQII